MKRPRPDELDLYIEAAFRDLPDIEIPPDFTDRVMARVFPERKPAFAWLAAMVGSVTGLFLGGLAYILITGQSLPGIALEAGKSLWGSGRDGILVLIKIGKLAALSLQLMSQFAGSLAAKLGRVGSLIDPRVYVALGVVFIAVSAFIYLGVKKRILNGEKP